MQDSRCVYNPVYGWGWRQGEHSIAVPEPFALVTTVATDGGPSGLVQAPHQFSGCNASLSLRGNAGGLARWNVTITGGSLSEPVTGFAQSITDYV